MDIAQQLPIFFMMFQVLLTMLPHEHEESARGYYPLVPGGECDAGDSQVEELKYQYDEND